MRNQHLADYLNAHPYHYETTERWPVQGDLRVRLSFGSMLPPAHVSSSILAIVLSGGDSLQGSQHEKPRVLYAWPAQRSGSIAHILIGGRPEPGETPEETAVREVAEETGWLVQPLRMIGFRHFFHLEALRAESDRPYPDFVQPIYAARALSFCPERMLPGDAVEVGFLDFDEVIASMEPAQTPLLTAALHTYLP